MKLTQELLKSVLNYNPDSGEFTWLVNIGSGSAARHPGDRAGYGAVRKEYRKIGIFGNEYYEHRLAFLYMTGRVPKFIDHKDRNGTNNVWSNLREATRSQNQGNRTRNKNNTSGYKGVWKLKDRWRAMIWYRGKGIHIGVFDTIEEAAVAYKVRAIELFGEFAHV